MQTQHLLGQRGPRASMEGRSGPPTGRASVPGPQEHSVVTSGLFRGAQWRPGWGTWLSGRGGKEAVGKTPAPVLGLGPDSGLQRGAPWQRHDEAASSLPDWRLPAGRGVWGSQGHSPSRAQAHPGEEGLCSRSVSIFYLFESGTGSSFKVSLK